MQPSAEKILSVLIELYAKQTGCKIKYIVERENKNEKSNQVFQAQPQGNY